VLVKHRGFFDAEVRGKLKARGAVDFCGVLN